MNWEICSIGSGKKMLCEMSKEMSKTFPFSFWRYYFILLLLFFDLYFSMAIYPLLVFKNKIILTSQYAAS